MSRKFLKEKAFVTGIISTARLVGIVIFCAFLGLNCSYLQKKPKPPDGKETGKITQNTTDKAPKGEEVPIKRGDKSADPMAMRTKQQTDKSETSDLEKPVSNTEPFKKHDHNAYLQKIKSAAIDVVNKIPDSFFARMCKDSITDQWTLHLYFAQGRQYWFISYNWDEVDEKWEESFKSDKRNMSVWKSHVNYSASGKECTILKGASKL